MQMIARVRGSRWKAIVWRALIVTHRYCGIVIGLLMVEWFISGIVMFQDLVLIRWATPYSASR